jgi:hypothetical protein
MTGDHGVNDKLRKVPVTVVEKRVSNLAQGSLVQQAIPAPQSGSPGRIRRFLRCSCCTLILCALLRRDRGPIVRDGFVDRH